MKYFGKKIIEAVFVDVDDAISDFSRKEGEEDCKRRSHERKQRWSKTECVHSLDLGGVESHFQFSIIDSCSNYRRERERESTFFQKNKKENSKKKNLRI